MSGLSRAATVTGHRLLARCALFRGLDERLREELASRAHVRQFAAGEPIFRIGEPGQSMAAVLSGMVRISMPSTQGREIVLAEIAAGEVFGEIALLDGKERTADAVALTKCELALLERRDVLPIFERDAQACLKLLEVLCERLRGADERISEIAFLDLAARLARALLRAATPESGDHSRKVALTQRELANMVGGVRESVNRCLAQWQRSGVIELDAGWIIIRDREALEKLTAAH
jgi:CRP/FNR family transcriptional regulator, cyclic AMP receptor protein